MAITNAQQARQLYRFGGDTMGGPNDKSANNSSDKGGSDFGQFERRQRQNQALQGAGFLGKDLGMNIGEQDRLAKFGDFIRGGGIIGNVLSSLSNILPTSGTPPKTFPGGGSDNMQTMPLWARLGFNSEAEYLASLQAQAPSITEQEPKPEEEKLEGLRLAFRANGGPIGGEYDFESARQMYGLGKLVKKVTRTVKKIAKSPVGKAALLYAGTAGLGSIGSGQTGLARFAPSNFRGNLGRIGAFITGGKLDPADILGGEMTTGRQNIFQRALGAFPGGGIGAAITAAAALPLLGLGTGDESEEEAEEIIRGAGLDINAIRANPNQFLARRFRAEGGSMKEPVAKKTMPLLDMDGQEMDLRAEGGFVPIGRMEKADDVPARLSKNEFVFTADAVRNAGDGNVDKGAEVMYNMMKNLESGGDVSEESQGLEGARKMFQTSQRLGEVI